jgi:nucleoside-diphosphate-sugar epimerase
MLSGEKILITGASSPVAEVLAAALAKNNEVWGAARFTDKSAPERLAKSNVKTVTVDLAAGDLSALPRDFTYVLHLAYFRIGEPDFERAFQVNGDAVGFVFSHCRNAKAALYMSSQVIYSFREDPWQAAKETDHIGWCKPGFSATSVISKIVGEGVARYSAREFNLPMVIARLNAPYGPTTGLPINNMDAVVAGKDVLARWDPEPYTPIHLDDMIAQIAPLLASASILANVVNWCGDENVTVQEWSRMAGRMAGVEAKLGTRVAEGSVRGSCSDPTKRRSITGPCKIPFREGYATAFEARHGTAKAAI